MSEESLGISDAHYSYSDSEIEAETQRQKTALLYRNAGVALTANIVASSLLVFVNITLHASATMAFIWWCSVAVTSMGRLVLARRFLAANPDAIAAAKWRQRYVFAISITAAAWSAGTVLFIWDAPDGVRLFTGLVIAGMVAGALPILAPVPVALKTFALAMLVPMSASILLQADSILRLAFGFMVIVFLGAVLASARYLHDTIDAAIRLGLEKGRMVSNLERARTTAEEALAELRQAEHAVRESEELFRAVAQSANDAIITADSMGSIIRWNRGAELIFGYTDTEVIGRPLTCLMPERFRDPHLAGMRRVSSGGEARSMGRPIEMRGLRKDGSEFPLEISLARWSTPEGHFFAGAIRDITERKAAEEKIQILAFTDSLTELPNRRLLLDRLRYALTLSARNKRHGALMLIDLDNFKTLNDTLGHDIGDTLLQQVAQRLTACIRDGDTVARLGGDEFVVMILDLSETAKEAASQTRTVAEKILATLNKPYALGSNQHHSTPSIGITLFNSRENSIENILKQTDLAMYQAKAAGRNTLCFFDPEMQANVSARADMESDLRQALSLRQFCLHYQPQVDSSGHWIGAEALLRWLHPIRGTVPPVEFISLAEETGLILPLGHWVLESACHQLVAWSKQPEMHHLTLAVNVSANQFGQANFVEEVLAVVERSGANPQKLKLELTESLLLENAADIIEKMTVLKGRGIGFSLDDFGTGYSSLSYLKRLPLDQLKIDQSFVRDILTDPNDEVIAKTIVALAESFGLTVIAEGVETSEQRDRLASNGCFVYQGYFFSPPLPAEEFEAAAKRNRV